MNPKQYHVSIHCPLLRGMDTVYFQPEQHDGTWYVKFCGCDHLYSKCQECDDCHRNAYQLFLEKYK